MSTKLLKYIFCENVIEYLKSKINKATKLIIKILIIILFFSNLIDNLFIFILIFSIFNSKNVINILIIEKTAFIIELSLYSSKFKTSNLTIKIDNTISTIIPTI